jgi:hypothetical protein
MKKPILTLLIGAGSFLASAQAPVFVSNFFNPCGGDGSNEFLIGHASTAAFDPMKLYYFVSGANVDNSGRDSVYQDAFCSSAAATGNGSSACNAIGWVRSAGVGSGSHRILNYTTAADKIIVDTVVNRLNARLANCASGPCASTFVAPDALTGNVPAGSNFIFCISSGINDTAVATGSPIDFCALCPQGPVYVVVGLFPPGVSGLVTNSSGTSRYISLAYDLGGATGLAEIYSYLHVPPATQVSGRNYYQVIPQAPNNVNNTTAQNYNTLDCSIAPNAVLPVDLASFTGRYINPDVQLNWQTASEKNTTRFEIMRSTDGNSFRTIGTVAARGNTSYVSDYAYTDKEAIAGKSYYKLKVVDIDGKLSFSPVIEVSTATTGNSLSLFPNPANGQVNLRVFSAKEQSAKVTLVNTTGKVVRSLSIDMPGGEQTISLSLKDIAAGLYYVKVQTADEVKIFSLVTR